MCRPPKHYQGLVLQLGEGNGSGREGDGHGSNGGVHNANGGGFGGSGVAVTPRKVTTPIMRVTPLMMGGTLETSLSLRHMMPRLLLQPSWASRI